MATSSVLLGVGTLATTTSSPNAEATEPAALFVESGGRSQSLVGGRLPADARLLQVQIPLDAAHRLRADLARVA
jgi:hypothetical protein